jgi:hypothetical protein
MKWNLQPKDESKKDFVVPFIFLFCFFIRRQAQQALK